MSNGTPGTQDVKEPKQITTGFVRASGGLRKRAVAMIILLLWYGLAIYSVVVTLAVQQFNARVNSVAAISSKSFAVLSILENEQLIAVAEVQAADDALAAREPDIAAIRADIETLQLAQLDLSADSALALDPSDSKKFATESAVMAGRQALLQQKIERIFAPKRAALDRLDEIQKKMTPAVLTALEIVRRSNEEKLQLEIYAKPFLSMPQELLTLILTLFMGVFGSTIAVSRSFFDTRIEGARGVNWYFFRPIQGAVMALAIYILFKAGVLVFSAPPSSGDVSGALNPFVIAFLGIISGLFAERAYARLDQAAESLFQPATTPAKVRALFAKGVDRELTDQNKSRADLAADLNQPENVVDQWVGGNWPVPEEVQEKISSWLGKPREDLFSEKSTEGATPGDKPGG